MIVRLEQFWRMRSVREQRLIALMLVVALPLAIGLLIARPVSDAYRDASERQALAVERHGRILARIEAIEEGTATVAPSPNQAPLALVTSEAASQAGLTLDSNQPAGPDAVSISIAQARPDAVVEWLTGFEDRGIVIEDMRMIEGQNGTVALTARLVRSSR